MDVPKQKIAELETRCREAGIPLTLQRRAVLEVLSGRTDHPTADEVFVRIAERYPGVSRATVYRGLETLVDLGLAVRVCHPGASTRYDAKTHRHHHLVCDRCGRILDYEEPRLDELPCPERTDAGFQVRDYSVHFRGVCGACAAGPTPPGGS